ncbi:MAG: phosphatidylserine decarboxylase, partial [Rhodanobacteraceae bacterium]
MTPGVLLQYLLPHKTLSRIVRVATRWRWRPWKNFLIACVIKRYRVDMSEAAQRDPFAYPHFNAFFTRALKPGARSAAGGEATVLCPADGRVSQAGRIHEGRVL